MFFFLFPKMFANMVTLRMMNMKKKFIFKKWQTFINCHFLTPFTLRVISLGIVIDAYILNDNFKVTELTFEKILFLRNKQCI